MPGPMIRVEGAREVRATLRKLDQGTKDMSAIHRKVAALVIPVAGARSRHQSGALAGSYRAKVSAAKAAVSSSLVYAPVQEFGWPRRGISASNALTGAVEELRPAIVDLYSRHVDDLVTRLNRTGG